MFLNLFNINQGNLRRRIYDPRIVSPVPNTEFFTQVGNGTGEQFRTSTGDDFMVRI